MPIIRASDIGNYLYCRRAWWYRRKGRTSANQAEMAAGTEIHARHGRQVLLSGLLHTLAWVLFIATLLLAIGYFTAKLF